MSAPPALLELHGLRVDRGGVRVLDVPAFRVAEGELVALLGPNGSGKTTLLLSMMAQYSGSFIAGVEGLRALLGCRGRVWPVSIEQASLCAHYADGATARVAGHAVLALGDGQAVRLDCIRRQHRSHCAGGLGQRLQRRIPQGIPQAVAGGACRQPRQLGVGHDLGVDAGDLSRVITGHQPSHGLRVGLPPRRAHLRPDGAACAAEERAHQRAAGEWIARGQRAAD